MDGGRERSEEKAVVMICSKVTLPMNCLQAISKAAITTSKIMASVYSKT
jgi:hypothetical protein